LAFTFRRHCFDGGRVKEAVNGMTVAHATVENLDPSDLAGQLL